jgi:hypothetical protein
MNLKFAELWEIWIGNLMNFEKFGELWEILFGNLVSFGNFD